MDIFSERPSRIFSSVALASLIAGLPLSLIISIFAATMASAPVTLELIKELLESAFFGVFFVFLCGIVLIAPLLLLLRWLGLGGPFFVYAPSLALGVSFFSNGFQAGAAVTVLALASSFVFCRFAYAPPDDR